MSSRAYRIGWALGMQKCAQRDLPVAHFQEERPAVNPQMQSALNQAQQTMSTLPGHQLPGGSLPMRQRMSEAYNANAASAATRTAGAQVNRGAAGRDIQAKNAPPVRARKPKGGWGYHAAPMPL